MGLEETDRPIRTRHTRTPRTVRPLECTKSNAPSPSQTQAASRTVNTQQVDGRQHCRTHCSRSSIGRKLHCHMKRSRLRTPLSQKRLARWVYESHEHSKTLLRALALAIGRATGKFRFASIVGDKRSALSSRGGDALRNNGAEKKVSHTKLGVVPYKAPRNLRKQ